MVSLNPPPIRKFFILYHIVMKKLLIALAVVATSFGANAQLLWKVSGNGSKGDSYLFGTHHVAPYTIMDSVEGFNQALRDVDIVMGEIDMLNMDQIAVQQATMQLAMAPADSMLTSLYSPQQLDSLNVILAKYMGPQVNAQALAPMKPAMIVTMLAMFQTKGAFPDFDETQQLDAMVQQRAKNAGKAVSGLETFEEQLNFLLGTPIALQAEQLMALVRNDDKSAELARELANAYLTQDIEKVQQMLEAESEDDSEAMARLLDNRNIRWVEKLGQVLPENTVLVAVGCGHLPGEKGLIELLRTRGYEVTPVK